jgi:hypothetical protein
MYKYEQHSSINVQSLQQIDTLHEFPSLHVYAIPTHLLTLLLAAHSAPLSAGELLRREFFHQRICGEEFSPSVKQRKGYDRLSAAGILLIYKKGTLFSDSKVVS